ncbi:MAG: hypothetical protein M3256_19330, partial [Actinomycetota bacterium]|nr:hypothetical protein [Actinomycetota bacterium]
AATWGLAMPGSALNVELGGMIRLLTSAAITIGAAAVLSLLFAPQLKTGTKTPGESPPGLAAVAAAGPDLVGKPEVGVRPSDNPGAAASPDETSAMVQSD